MGQESVGGDLQFGIVFSAAFVAPAIVFVASANIMIDSARWTRFLRLEEFTTRLSWRVSLSRRGAFGTV